MTHIRASAAEAPVVRWLLDRLLQEMTTDRPCADFAAHQHAQLLFVEVLRAYLAGSESLPAGLLRTLADERLVPARRLMHAEPGRSWHLEELARAAAMSRTTFSERFKAVAGVPPLTYLPQWRMRIAERALRAAHSASPSRTSRLPHLARERAVTPWAAEPAPRRPLRPRSSEPAVQAPPSPDALAAFITV